MPCMITEEIINSSFENYLQKFFSQFHIQRVAKLLGENIIRYYYKLYKHN